MEVRPDSVVRFYSGIPFDSTYVHTLWFNDVTAQNNYFHNGTRHKFEVGNMSYQRVNRGVMRVEIPADDLYDCNYMAFRNTKYSGKWFYAFITMVEYVNDKTASVTYEIDDVQTWLFDVEMKECYVEREHSASDAIGDNILPEPVEVGEYVDSDGETVRPNTVPSGYCVIVLVADEQTGINGGIYNGVYCGADIYAYNSTDTDSLKAFLNDYIQQPDAILSLYMCPAFLLPTIPTGGKRITPLDTAVINNGYAYNCKMTNATDKFGNYLPKNKKLYTYPYNYLRVDNNSGQSLALRYEFFKTLTPNTCPIKVYGTVIPPVKVMARPMDYKGHQGSDITPISNLFGSTAECITLENYPQCAWGVDSYASWLAQNSVPIALNLFTGAASTAISTVAHPITPSSVGRGISHGINTFVDIFKEAYSASIIADQCRGNIASGNVNMAVGTQDFYAWRCHITEDYARMIDHFFTVFGYSCKKVKVPNRNSRPKWNYVKTAQCNLIGSAPSDAIRHLCEIYNNGITFWKNASEVGNYSLNNSPS